MINWAGDRHSGQGRQRLRKLTGFREASNPRLPQIPLSWTWESSRGARSRGGGAPGLVGGCLGKGKGKLASGSGGEAFEPRDPLAKVLPQPQLNMGL